MSRFTRLALSFVILGLIIARAWVYFLSIHESISVQLFGKEVDLNLIYRSDLTGRGRELGGFFTVYELPSNLRESLLNDGIILSEFPKSRALGSDYQCIKWTDKLLESELGSAIYEMFRIEQRNLTAPPVSVTSDLEAAQLATRLIARNDGILCGGWCKEGGRLTDEIWVVDAYLYVWDIKNNRLVMFGLDT